MSDARKTAVADSAMQVLLPLAAFLRGAGLGIGDLISFAKLAMVQDAAGQSGKNSRAERISATRIAAETGLHRNEVVELLRQKPHALPPQKRGRVRAERVLYGWWTDPEFQDEFGRPAPLRMRSSKTYSGPSLVGLVQRYSGTPRAKSIVDELLRCKAVRQQADGRYRAVRKSCANIEWDKDTVAELGLQLRLHFEGLLQNLNDPVGAPQLTRLRVSGPIDPLHMRVLLRDLRAEGERYLETAGDRMNHPRHAARTEASDARQLSVAVQVIEGPFNTIEGSQGARKKGHRPRTHNAREE